MILIENRAQHDPHIEVYTFNNCTVKEYAENGQYLVIRTTTAISSRPSL